VPPVVVVGTDVGPGEGCGVGDGVSAARRTTIEAWPLVSKSRATIVTLPAGAFGKTVTTPVLEMVAAIGFADDHSTLVVRSSVERP
jgi:hypothetical protein